MQALSLKHAIPPEPRWTLTLLTITRNGGDITYLEWDNDGHCTAVAGRSGFKQHFTYNNRGRFELHGL